MNHDSPVAECCVPKRPVPPAIERTVSGSSHWPPVSSTALDAAGADSDSSCVDIALDLLESRERSFLRALGGGVDQRLRLLAHDRLLLLRERTVGGKLLSEDRNGVPCS